MAVKVLVIEPTSNTLKASIPAPWGDNPSAAVGNTISATMPRLRPLSSRLVSLGSSP